MLFYNASSNEEAEVIQMKCKLYILRYSKILSFTLHVILSLFFMNPTYLDEILGSDNGEYEDVCLWDVAPYSVVEIGRRFRDAYCLSSRP
jgi:hypothetical protein